jgi:uncharacterized protein (TIRG00374 family)
VVSRRLSRADALRVSIALAAFGAILWWVGPRDVVAAFANVLWFWVVIRIVPYVASLWIQARRWKMFLGLEGITTETSRLFRRIWMSRFFANTLPGSIGGDIFRVVESGDFSNSKMAVARSVLLDRVVAIVGLGLYTSTACLVWAWLRNWPGLRWVAAIGLVGSALAALLLASGWPRRMASWTAEKLRAGRARTFVSQLTDSLSDLAGQRSLLVAAVLITVLFNVTWAISSYCGFLALGLTISPLLVITLIPVVYAVTALPTSINGLGVSDSVFVLVFATVGLQPGEAAAVAILLRVTGLMMSSLGGLLYLVERRRLMRATAL